MKTALSILSTILTIVVNLGCISHDTPSTGTYPIHLYISNQGALLSANITIQVNNETMFNNQTLADDGHNYTILTLYIPKNRIMIYAMEHDTQTIGREEVNMTGERWIQIDFIAHTINQTFAFRIDIFDHEIGIT